MKTTQILGKFFAVTLAVTTLVFSWASLVRALGFHFFPSYNLIGPHITHAWYNSDLSLAGFIGVTILVALTAVMLMTAGNKKIW